MKRTGKAFSDICHAAMLIVIGFRRAIHLFWKWGNNKKGLYLPSNFFSFFQPRRFALRALDFIAYSMFTSCLAHVVAKSLSPVTGYISAYCQVIRSVLPLCTIFAFLDHRITWFEVGSWFRTRRLYYSRILNQSGYIPVSVPILIVDHSVSPLFFVSTKGHISLICQSDVWGWRIFRKTKVAQANSYQHSLPAFIVFHRDWSSNVSRTQAGLIRFNIDTSLEVNRRSLICSWFSHHPTSREELFCSLKYCEPTLALTKSCVSDQLHLYNNITYIHLMSRFWYGPIVGDKLHLLQKSFVLSLE